ncbi:unnamed protein product [Triticum turgidum subsp. durum]|uniref:RCC1-like domain-containing protein n=1 Tax=Triticum turgidum subsp. durum TaxID=4567 RepID=A0A9R1R713_TRITD|nr:unnamed protein product [Triticum turgidum subsp. durum]
MEPSVSPPGAPKQAGTRRPCTGCSVKDLCLVSKQGSIAEVESALALIKKNDGSIDGRNAFGLGALHLATWRNHLPIVRRLLDAGANPDARDGESGWSSLHRALHFGHLCIAGVLLQFGASLNLEDTKGRTPIDLLSGPVSQANGDSPNSGCAYKSSLPFSILVATEVFSWGSGTNYQLGTGNAHIQKLPCKVDALHGSYIKTVAASKFHSVAVSSDGELYTWGFGRGGRLGHPDIQSGQTTAVITPRQVTVGLGRKKVNVVAAAKHHTVIATSAGELFTWGSNREGQLGYPSVDTQPTPRRVSSLKQRIIAVAAANKHSAAVADTGEVFTWGSNKEGQLGYGTSNSASNCIPRMVEYLKGKVFKGVSAAKYHTLVFGADGEVFTWGHRLVTPRRVVIARCLKKGGNANVKFHRMERLQVISVAAGVMHSTALTADGAICYWNSSDLDLRCQQIFSMCGRNVVSISAGKYWTALATSTGDVFMCDAKKRKDETPVFTRVNGVKRASSVCVGETHMLVLSSIYHPEYPPKPKFQSKKPSSEWSGVMEELDEDILFTDVQPETDLSVTSNEMSKGIPSLKSLCEKVAIQHIMEPKNAIQLLEVADSLEAKELKKHCEDTAIRNLDYIFTVAAPSIMNASPEILANLERLLDEKSSEPWSHRRLPTMTATYPAVIDSDAEGDNAGGFPRLRDNQKPASKLYGMSGYGNFLQKESNAEQFVSKQIRAIRKKLQQIEMLEAKQLDGHQLDDQQLAKLESRASLESELAELGFPTEAFSRPSVYVPNKKSEGSKKQKKKIKQAAQSDITSIKHEDKEQNHNKELPEVLPTHGSSEKARCTRAHPGCWRWGREEGASAGGLPTKALAGKRCEGLQDGDAEKAVPVRPQHHNTRSEARLLRPCSVHGSRAEATTQIWRGLAPPPICPDHQLRQLLQSIRPPLEADALDPGRGSLRWRPLVNAAYFEVTRPMNLFTGLSDGGYHRCRRSGIGDLPLLLENLKEPVKPSDDGTSSNTKAIFYPLGNKASRPTSSKKKNKKGGLSLFLSGALDDTSKLSLPTPAVPVTPKQEGPAWGGAKITKGPASLRDIQSEQRSKTNELVTTKAKDRHEDSPDSAGLLRLSSFMPDACSSPISVTPARAVPAHEGDKSTPPWSSSATSPNLSRPSLRDIQMQQEKRHHGVVSHSPKTRTSGFAIPSLGAAPEVVGVKDNVPNRWFKPETDTPSSIRSIQIEEQAMKDFKRFYTTVRIMKPQV